MTQAGNQMVGRQFGRLTVVEYSHTSPGSKRYWTCQCSCGKTSKVVTNKLTSGLVQSCGCKKREDTIARNKAKGEAVRMTALADMPGKKFRMLTVRNLHTDGATIKDRKWNCDCDCGNQKAVSERDLIQNEVQSCGCLLHLPQHVPDLEGELFGKLLVLEQAGKDRSGNILWKCQCDCGNVSYPRTSSLISGASKSCGCQMLVNATAANSTHGMTGSPEFCSWTAMRRRCYNPNASNYKYYGAKGIRVCDRWKDDFSKFYADMGDRPEGTTLDRIDGTKGYYKANCRWATYSEQSYNQGVPIDNTSGVKGVCQNEYGKWSAYLNYEKKVILNQTFDTFEEAVEARRVAEVNLYDSLESKEKSK